jgi:spore coat polysaccharide biosynthesis protein SpsF
MIAAVVQARMSSSRLPGKVLEPLVGAPMLGRQLERIRGAQLVSKVIVATSEGPDDDPVAAVAADWGAECYRGSLEDVLDRLRCAALRAGADHVVRLTADCPLTDPQVVDEVIRAHLEGAHDYTSNVLEPSFPDGLDVEVVRREALERAWNEARDAHEREHVTPFLYRHPEEFSLGSVRCREDLSSRRWTVDHEEDLTFVRRVFEELYPQDPAFTMWQVLDLLEREPHLSEINSAHVVPRPSMVEPRTVR